MTSITFGFLEKKGKKCTSNKMKDGLGWRVYLNDGKFHPGNDKARETKALGP